jgi:S-methylmethionine-dependent homocysteine/selenocysteine methylase
VAEIGVPPPPGPGAASGEAGALRRARSPGYRHVEALLGADRCVILDGGVETEVQRLSGRTPDQELWGTGALYQVPETVLDVHRGHLAAGCDVLSTATWSILSAPEIEQRVQRSDGDPHWIDVARLGIQLARKATLEAGRERDCAVAFAISEEVNSPRRRQTIELLARMFADDPPDMLLLETLTLIREPATFEIVELLLETGFPLWLSYRRCRHGVCGVYGQHWGPPEGDLFGRAARRFEEMGIDALLINCLPVGHLPGMLSWLRDFTELPLGVYPNLGHLAGPRWRFDETIGPEAYAELACGWRDEGAQVIGGCCGVTCDHIAALRPALADTKPGRRRPPLEALLRTADSAPRRTPEPWLDGHGANLFPLPLPELAIDSDVFAPSHGSFLVWKHLFRSRAGHGLRCLDVGCGCGIQTVQLALNGAEHVYAIDIERSAVINTVSNAYRNGVGDRVSGEDVDLYQWTTDERYDLVVASLFQMPVDPYEEPSGHRPLDYWGRNLLDHFLDRLPHILTDTGSALVMHLSIVGRAATSQRLAQAGLQARVVDFTPFPFGALFTHNKPQIERVEQISDAYHLKLGGDDTMVAYLLEVSRVAG